MDADFLHLATGLDPQWKDLKVNNKSVREGCWGKLRAEMDLQKGEEDVVRDKVYVSRLKRRLLDINESDDDSDALHQARWMSSPGFEILAFTKEFLDYCNR